MTYKKERKATVTSLMNDSVSLVQADRITVRFQRLIRENTGQLAHSIDL